MHLLESSLEGLGALARKRYELFQQRIREQDSYGLLELSDNELALITPGSGTQISVGFPFPLKTFEGPSTDKAVHFFLRGEPIRKEQRQYISDSLGLPLTVVSKNYFAAQAEPEGQTLYVDPYTFIGDGIIGLHFRDRIVGKKTPVLSRNEKHIPDEETFPYTPEGIIQVRPNTLIVPDLVDTHIGYSLELIKAAEHAKILIPGRNLLITEGRILSTGSPDVILRRKNIEDYMEECLEPFNPKHQSMLESTFPRTAKKILLNGVSSSSQKDIPPVALDQLCRELYSLGAEALYLSKGTIANEKDLSWCNEFSILANKAPYRHILQSPPMNNLRTMAEVIKKQNIDLVLTADTSVTHLANYLGVPNITVHIESFWDPNSPQSLAGSSPVGFNRYVPGNVPFIFGKKTHEATRDLRHGVHALFSTEVNGDAKKYDALLHQLSKSSSREEILKTAEQLAEEYATLNNLASECPYNPFTLVSATLKQPHIPRALIKAAFKNAPAYKAIIC